MAAIVWDASGARHFETGVDHAVLYPIGVSGDYPTGVAWNGLTGITESPSGAENNPLYADNIKYLNLQSAEEFGGTIEAYTYPDEWGQCDGSASPVTGVKIGQQSRKMFGLCYRTILGNDVDGQSHGFLLHLIWGAQASPSERAYQTVNESPEAITFSWEITTTPIPVTGFKPTSYMVIDSTKVDEDLLADLMDTLYGTDGTPGTTASLPLPDAVITALTPA